MNKMKKLLSVLLAVVLAFSALSVLGSAAKTSYKTVDELTALSAYSPYGQVTRLSLEERTSIVFDALDNLLGKANINMGTVFDVLGLSVTINLTSIDNLCISLDSIKDTFENWLASIAMAIINLGILESLETGEWVTGMSRDGTDQFTILSTLLAFLSDNTTLVGKVFTDGLDLGIVSLGDMSAIEDIIMDLPSMVKGIIFPMLERKDDTLADIKNLDTWGTGDGNVEVAINTFVQNLFTDNRSTTTVKYESADPSTMTSEHEGLPIVTTDPTTTTPTDTSLRYVYYLDADNKLWTCHIADQAEADASVEDPAIADVTAYTYVKEEVPYELKQEIAGWDGSAYTWQATDAWNNTWTLKYMNDDSPWLPSLAAAIEAGTVTIDLSSDDISAGDLLYTMIPYVFKEMAPVVLNGSLKKIVGGLFGIKYTKVGEVGSDEVNALADSSNAFFTQEQGEYLWEWSDYAVINGTHYYRYEDQIFKGDTSNANHYAAVVNWDYEITDDFLDEFIPTSDADSSDRILTEFNNFLVKVVETVFAEEASWTYLDAEGNDVTLTWTRPEVTEGDNTNLINNIKTFAQAFIKFAPWHIFGSDYATSQRCYYSLLISDDNDTVLTGIAAQLVDMIMPSMYLPDADKLIASNAKVGAILAAVIREFAGELIAEYDYDALIYTDYGTTEADPDKTFVDPTAAGLVTSGSTESGYWFDVILTMAMDAGYEYLRAFADLGEDTDYCAGAVNAGYMAAGGTYAAGTTQATLNAQWEGMLDYIIDWALTDSLEWTWKFANIVDCSSLTIDLATAQDPWVKLDTIIDAVLPIIDQVLTITPTEAETEIEQFLRYDLILGIVDLDWAGLIDTLAFSNAGDDFGLTLNIFRTGNILDCLAKLLKTTINSLLGYVGLTIIPDVITDFDTLAVQDNLVTLVKNLVGSLYTAGVTNSGCDTIFPFLNFFLGWKTDPQVIADPVIWTSFRDGNDYAFQWTGNGVYPTMDADNTKIIFLNNSAGMLETHRDSSVTDHAYDIEIKSVTSDATVNTLTFSFSDGEGVVSPYEQLEILVGGTYAGDEAVTVTIAYDYVGKDGAAVGGTQYTSLTFLISNLYEDSNIDGRWDGDDDKDYTGTANFKTFVFTEDIYNTVVNYEKSIYFVKATVNLVSSKDFVSCQPEGYATDCDGNVTSAGDVPTGTAANYFSQYMGQAGGWASTIYADSDPSTTTAKLFYANSGVSADTEFPYGAYDMGGVGIKYGSDTKVHYVDFIYYNDYDIDVLWNEHKGDALTINSVDTTDSEAVAAYNAYNTALKKVAYLATYPMMTTARNSVDSSDVGAGTSANDYVTVIMPQIEAAKEALTAAYEALEPFMAEANASAGADAALPEYVSNLETELAKDAWTVNPNITATDKEVNYQDYEYYEYFNYADIRTSARNLVKTYYAPEILDTYYIEGSGISEAELDDVIAAEDNSIIAAGITASRSENTYEDISASVTARNEWVMPVNTKLYVDDLTSRVAYYKQFLKAENDDHATFLDREIAHVNAQGFNSADYTEDSWNAYAEALANAEALSAEAAAGVALNSDIKSTQWNLMVARKNLLLKTNSLIEAGGTATLAANAETANEIFASLEAGDGAWAVKEGVDAETAYAMLISALGYYYVGEDGETYNLYADSALEYIDNDRPNRTSNQTKVNAANATLETALANFEAAAEELEPNTIMLKEDAPFEAIIDTNNNVNGEYAGTIYGFDTMGINADLAADGAIADFITTAYGDDYLEIIESDGGETTGTIINVLDENGEVIESYIYILFGDVDKDGWVGGSDAYMCEYYELMLEGIDSVEIFMAGDVDSDAWTGGSDAYMMEYFELNLDGMPTQADIGALNVDNYYELI